MSQSTQTNAMSYARAVYELAIESWQQQLYAVQEKLAADPKLLTTLNNSSVPFADRQAKLDGLLPADVTGQTKNFLYTLLKAGDLDQLQEVADKLSVLANKGTGLQVVTVTTALPLPKAKQADFEKKLSAQYGEAIDIVFSVDESIMGGVVVQIGDKILDGSLATKLNTARDTLRRG